MNVLFFASLREQVQTAHMSLDVAEPISARAVWQQSTGQTQLPTNVLIAVNQVYADADSLVNPDDEIAFFPPVTGG